MSIRLLVVARYDSPESLRDRVLGGLMIDAFARRGIDWTLHRPWETEPDLGSFDAVLFWSYRYARNNYFFWAAELEARCRDRGLPVINSVAQARAPHSYFLRTWADRGVPCARAQRFARVDDIALPFPLILRRDGIHMGRDVVRVETREAARDLVETRRAEILATAPRRLRSDNFDLAIEFVDTRDASGIYRKWRVLVFGDRVVPRHVLLSRHWLVNFGNLVEGDEAVAEDRAFQHDGPAEPELVRRAARATGSDIVALDYGRRPDGTLVFWEANRHFLLLGDPGYQLPEKFHAATGRDDAERMEGDRAIGDAIADLVSERAGERHAGV